jgi:hypothetical protein
MRDLTATLGAGLDPATVEVLTSAEQLRQLATAWRTDGLEACNENRWDDAEESYRASLYLFQNVTGINVEDEVNLTAVLYAALLERAIEDETQSYREPIEDLYRQASAMRSGFMGELATIAFAVRIKYGDLKGAELALREKERHRFETRDDWRLLELEYGRRAATQA